MDPEVKFNHVYNTEARPCAGAGVLTPRCTNLIQSQTRSHQLSSWRWWLKLDFWCIIWMTTSVQLILNMIRCCHIRLMTTNYPHYTPSPSLSPSPHWPTLHSYLVISRETYTQECHYGHFLRCNCNKIYSRIDLLGHTVWLFQCYFYIISMETSG